jgi:hypothetical protein
MKKVKLIGMCTMLFIVIMCTTSIGIDNNEGYGKDVWINNRSDNDLKIRVVDVNIVEEKINIGDSYNASAIITMNVANNGLYDVELSNIDIYPYQGGKPIKYFVTTSKDNVSGFIGNIKSGDSKNIKIGVALHNTKESIKLEMSNIEDITNEKVMKSIKIK